MDAKRTPTPAGNGKSKAEEQAVAARLSDNVHETIDRVLDAGHPALDRLAEQAHDTVQKVAEVASKAGEGMQAQTAQVKEVQAAFAEDCRAFVRNNPLKALLYAAAAGVLLTRLLRD